MTDAKPIPPLPRGWFDRPDRYEVRDCGYETPCWVWRLSTTGVYGQVVIHLPDGRQQGVRAHRIYFERENGPITDYRAELDHLCRNPRCVNPAHLELVTPAENVRRSVRPCKLALADVQRIRASREPERAIAPRFGVSRSLIGSIRRNEIYREVIA